MNMKEENARGADNPVHALELNSFTRGESAAEFTGCARLLADFDVEFSKRIVTKTSAGWLHRTAGGGGLGTGL